ncbi:hypothetical protein R3Q06_32305 [Rhodococcus erythropolis]|uniref:hypothetical protein n=1 Tax=Rhodococcus erythropolis TaxID=1833 RepID=UPI0029493572|nr:hypothetical protein [Rhodococcus erythropolis]MDV6278156.1 hypothetical protein [Rhodococcus erythropolis]
MPSTLVISAVALVYPFAVCVPDAVHVRAGKAICSATEASNGLPGTGDSSAVTFTLDSSVFPAPEHPTAKAQTTLIAANAREMIRTSPRHGDTADR